MQLNLDDDDALLLREVLDSTFRDLKYEIADTDDWDFKQELKQRESRISAILDQVGGTLPDRE